MRLIIFILSFSLLSGQIAQARALVIAVSPYGDAAKAKSQATQLLQFLTTLEPGDEAVLLDGYNLATIGTFKIPDNPSYNSPKARLAANRGVVGTFLRFAGSASAPSGNSAPTLEHALRIPQLLRQIAVNFAAKDTIEVLLLGSPFYDDPRDKPFSMAGGRFPSDGHLLASRSKTPYGIVGQSELLFPLRIHIGYGDENVMQSDRHRYFIERFWALYIEKQGGELVTFTGDTPSLFRRVKTNAAPPKHHYETDTSDKLEMIILRTGQIRQSII